MIKSESNVWLIRIGGFAMSIAIMVSSWFLNQAWDRINKVEDIVHTLELNSASSNSNKFTNTDWITAKAVLENNQQAIDRRVMRLEENSTVIKDSLIRIESGLNRHIDGVSTGK